MLLVEVVLGMAIALLLWRPFKGEKWVRVAILMPLVATPVAVGMMWRLIFDPNIGLANTMLGWVGIAPQPWLAGQNTALPTTMFIDIWQWTPMVVLILLAGLTSLSDEPQEAARIDGASGLAAVPPRHPAAADADRHRGDPAARHRRAEDLRHPLRHQGQAAAARSTRSRRSTSTPTA